MSYDKWEVDDHDEYDKSFEIHGPEISLTVDYDDVDHRAVDKEVRRIVNLLNKHDK